MTRARGGGAPLFHGRLDAAISSRLRCIRVREWTKRFAARESFEGNSESSPEIMVLTNIRHDSISFAQTRIWRSPI